MEKVTRTNSPQDDARGKGVPGIVPETPLPFSKDVLISMIVLGGSLSNSWKHKIKWHTDVPFFWLIGDIMINHSSATLLHKTPELLTYKIGPGAPEQLN